MRLNYQHEATTLIGQAIATGLIILLIWAHSAARYAHKRAAKIPTNPQPLVSLAAGLGDWAANTTDKEDSV